jgi:hypothetical protein
MKLKQLFLEDLAKKTDAEVRAVLLNDYQATQEELDRFNILIAYESTGSWGCDSSAWYLLRDKKTKALFEVHASHCSCYGFEGQFKPEPTTLKYLKSEKFHFCCGGYDSNGSGNKQQARDFISALKR